MTNYFVIEKRENGASKINYLTSKTWAFKFFNDRRYTLSPQERDITTLEIIETSGTDKSVLATWNAPTFF